MCTGAQHYLFIREMKKNDSKFTTHPSECLKQIDNIIPLCDGCRANGTWIQQQWTYNKFDHFEKRHCFYQTCQLPYDRGIPYFGTYSGKMRTQVQKKTYETADSPILIQCQTRNDPNTINKKWTNCDTKYVMESTTYTWMNLKITERSQQSYIM